MVLWRSSCTSRRIVSTLLGVELVEGRPDLSSSSSDVLPLLKRACRSKHLARLMSLFLYARRIISKVSAPDLPSFTQNLMFALCSSFTSMLKLQMWRRTWWQTLVLCNSQCSHSDATQRAEWWRSLLPSTVHCALIHVLPSVGGLWNKSQNFLIHPRINPVPPMHSVLCGS